MFFGLTYTREFKSHKNNDRVIKNTSSGIKLKICITGDAKENEKEIKFDSSKSRCGSESGVSSVTQHSSMRFYALTRNKLRRNQINLSIDPGTRGDAPLFNGGCVLTRSPEHLDCPLKVFTAYYYLHCLIVYDRR